MTTWILVLLMNVRGPFIAPIEFNSKENCEKALVTIKSTSVDYLRGVCVEK